MGITAAIKPCAHKRQRYALQIWAILECTLTYAHNAIRYLYAFNTCAATKRITIYFSNSIRNRNACHQITVEIQIRAIAKRVCAAACKINIPPYSQVGYINALQIRAAAKRSAAYACHAAWYFYACQSLAIVEHPCSQNAEHTLFMKRYIYQTAFSKSIFTQAAYNIWYFYKTQTFTPEKCVVAD